MAAVMLNMILELKGKDMTKAVSDRMSDGVEISFESLVTWMESWGGII